MINNLYQPHQQDQLYCQRNQGCEWIVFFSLKYFRLLVCDAVRISEMLCLDPVDLRLHLHHFDRVLLYPDGNRQQNDLTDQCEQNNSQTVIMCHIITKVHHIA